MPRAITIEQKRKAIRLRVDENMSTPKIARVVGICNQATYRILQNYPWKRERKAPTRGKLWTYEDDKTLRRLWPVAEQDEIIAALPGRSWFAISRHASELKIRRRMPTTRRRSRAVHPLLEKLRVLREEQRLTRQQLMEKVGYHVNQILAWETGKTRPRLQHVEDLAGALGFVLTLMPKAANEVIAFPDRKKLMAGR